MNHNPVVKELRELLAQNRELMADHHALCEIFIRDLNRLSARSQDAVARSKELLAKPRGTN